ncbi:ATP-binding protein [Streptomyces sp. PTM05]|uniref:ATP-binding protein n=1 Tax=Streptantibioticus parmotrematis TaxID=2873249 RepID=A0ABS7QPU3_9ACTN|nr:ATP-binding protein [Streptantibioticus parmotrematis]
MNAVTSPRTSECEWRLPRTPRSAGRSRALLRARAHDWKLAEDAIETAVLLVSELVTNACTHARSSPGREIGVRCVLSGGRLRVEVSDAGDAWPKRREAGDEDESGRGLALVEALADAWDVEPRPYGVGKTVWFELAAPDPPVQPEAPENGRELSP